MTKLLEKLNNIREHVFYAAMKSVPLMTISNTYEIGPDEIDHCVETYFEEVYRHTFPDFLLLSDNEYGVTLSAGEFRLLVMRYGFDFPRSNDWIRQRYMSGELRTTLEEKPAEAKQTLLIN